jgi:glycosyltransferase involved in cell wall biosynthesis
MKEMSKILALIPAYNESARVANVVAGARAFLPVLVVDDGSTDDTGARAEAAGAVVLHQAPNQGKGAALRAGFRWALDEGYEAVLTLDADGQHEPAEIPKFLDAHDKGQSARQDASAPDLIIGARDFRQIPVVRRAANTLGRWSFSWALGQPVLDNQSGYRLISRRLLEATLISRESGFEFEVEMIVICVQRGYTLDWVPIRTIYGSETSHINPAEHVVNFLRVVWETRQRVKHGKHLS